MQERVIEPLFNKVGFHHSNSRCINATPYFNSRFIRPLLATAPPAYLSLLFSKFGTTQLSFEDLITCDSPLNISPTVCTDGLSLLFYPAIFWVSLCVYPCRQELHPNNRVCTCTNTQLVYIQHKIYCNSQYSLSMNNFLQLLNVMLGTFIMVINHNYLHTCFVFVRINMGLLSMSITS